MLKPLSNDQLKKATKLFGDDISMSDVSAVSMAIPVEEVQNLPMPTHREAVTPTFQRVRNRFSAFDNAFDDSLPPTPPPREQHQPPPIDATSPIPVGPVGFSTGRGKTLKSLSSAQMQRVAKLFGDDMPLVSDPIDGCAAVPSVSSPCPPLASDGQVVAPTVGFATARGETLKSLALSKLANAKRLFGDILEEDELASAELSEPSKIKAPETTSDAPVGVFQTGSGRSVKLLDPEKLARAKSLFGDDLEGDAFSDQALGVTPQKQR